MHTVVFTVFTVCTIAARYRPDSRARPARMQHSACRFHAAMIPCRHPLARFAATASRRGAGAHQTSGIALASTVCIADTLVPTSGCVYFSHTFCKGLRKAATLPAALRLAAPHSAQLHSAQPHSAQPSWRRGGAGHEESHTGWGGESPRRPRLPLTRRRAIAR